MPSVGILSFHFIFILPSKNVKIVMELWLAIKGRWVGTVVSWRENVKTRARTVNHM